MASSVLISSINGPLTDIPELNRQYGLAISDVYTDAEVESLVSNILTHATWIDSKNDAQLGKADSTQGLMDLTSQTLSKRLLTNDDQEAIQAQSDYYQNFQLIAANLLVKANHASSPVKAFDAEAQLDKYFISEKKQNGRLNTTTLVTPSAFFPVPDASGFSNLPTIQPFPPPLSLSQFLQKTTSRD